MNTDHPVPKPTIDLGCAIHFSKDSIWIKSEGRSDDEPEAIGFAFLHLYTNFSCRILVNATKEAVRSELLARYATMPQNEAALRDLASCYTFSLVNRDDEGTFGTLGSILQLKQGEYGSHGYQMTIEGFGFRSRKAEDNVAPAVTALTAQLMQSETSWNSEALRGRFIQVGPKVADYYRRRALTIQDQHEVAQQIAREVWIERLS